MKSEVGGEGVNNRGGLCASVSELSWAAAGNSLDGSFRAVLYSLCHFLCAPFSIFISPPSQFLQGACLQASLWGVTSRAEADFNALQLCAPTGLCDRYQVVSQRMPLSHALCLAPLQPFKATEHVLALLSVGRCQYLDRLVVGKKMTDFIICQLHSQKPRRLLGSSDSSRSHGREARSPGPTANLSAPAFHI